MRLLSILLMMSCMTWSVSALELYQETSKKKVSNVSKTKIEEVNLNKGDKKALVRKVGLGVESLISRGDIRLNYEWLTKSNKWNYIFTGHINPHPKSKEETGTVGALAGARLYLDQLNDRFFTEAKAGLNIEEDEGVFVTEFGAGFVQEWKNDIFYEFGLGLSRSYGSVNDELKAYLMVNLMIGYPYKILGF